MKNMNRLETWCQTMGVSGFPFFKTYIVIACHSHLLLKHTSGIWCRGNVFRILMAALRWFRNLELFAMTPMSTCPGHIQRFPLGIQFFSTWGLLGTHGVDMACLPKHFEKMSLPEHLISPCRSCRHLIFAFSQHPVYNEWVQETTRFPDPESWAIKISPKRCHRMVANPPWILVPYTLW